jgi:hypothetical protein
MSLGVLLKIAGFMLISFMDSHLLDKLLLLVISFHVNLILSFEEGLAVIGGLI